MNLYFLGILAALVVFFAVGIGAGRMVKDTNDYYVSGRNAPTLLIVGSLIASFLSTGAFLGDTGEVYSGFFIGIVTVGVIQATGYIYGAGFFGRYIRRSEVTTLGHQPMIWLIDDTHARGVFQYEDHMCYYDDNEVLQGWLVYCDDFVKGDDGAWRIQKLRMAYREMDGSFRSTMVPKDWVPDEWDTPNY